jgi:hypothetical protein
MKEEHLQTAIISHSKLMRLFGSKMPPKIFLLTAVRSVVYSDADLPGEYRRNDVKNARYFPRTSTAAVPLHRGEHLTTIRAVTIEIVPELPSTLLSYSRCLKECLQDLWRANRYSRGQQYLSCFWAPFWEMSLLIASAATHIQSTARHTFLLIFSNRTFFISRTSPLTRIGRDRGSTLRRQCLGDPMVRVFRYPRSFQTLSPIIYPIPGRASLEATPVFSCTLVEVFQVTG